MTTERPTCYNKALDFLARRSHFRLELAHKLARREYSAEEIDTALEKLAANRFLDDLRTAEEWVRHRRGKALGRRRLWAELKERGLSAEDADTVLDEVLGTSDGDDELELVRQVAERWQRSRNADLTDPKRRASLARHLERRGFASHVIFSVLDAMTGH